MATGLVLICAAFAVLSDHACPTQSISRDLHPLSQLKEAKFRVNKLEVLLDETTKKIDSRSTYLKHLETSLQEQENQIQQLRSSLSGIKGGNVPNGARVDDLKAEVKVLWAASRKNNFDLHALESKATDLDDAVKTLASDVEKVSDVVNENWIQIQQLEQIREFNARMHHSSTECSFFKFINYLYETPYRKVVVVAGWYSSEYLYSGALQDLESLWTSFVTFHHKFQGIIRQEMERTKLTAAVANKEVVFFLASVIIISPIIGAWLLLKP